MAMQKNDSPIERAAREFRWSFVLSALAYILLGLFLVIWPDASMNVLCYLIGSVLTLYGFFNIFSFIFGRDRSFSIELVIGVVTAAIGIFSLVSPNTIRDILSILLGLIVVIDSLIGIKRAFSLKELGLAPWWVLLLLSLASALLGVLFMIRKELFGEALLIVVGIVLMYEGISDLVMIMQISVLGKRLKKGLSSIVRDDANIIDADTPDGQA